MATEELHVLSRRAYLNGMQLREGSWGADRYRVVSPKTGAVLYANNALENVAAWLACTPEQRAAQKPAIAA